MGKYKIEVKKSAEKELRKIPQKELTKIIQLIGSLADEPYPSGCQKLTNQEKYRIRIGNYRVLYNIENDILTVFVVKVGHRKEIYR